MDRIVPTSRHRPVAVTRPSRARAINRLTSAVSSSGLRLANKGVAKMLKAPKVPVGVVVPEAAACAATVLWPSGLRAVLCCVFGFFPEKPSWWLTHFVSKEQTT